MRRAVLGAREVATNNLVRTASIRMFYLIFILSFYPNAWDDDSYDLLLFTEYLLCASLQPAQL